MTLIGTRTEFGYTTRVAYGASFTSDWRHEAACRGANPLLFEECTGDTDPKLSVVDRNTVTNMRFKEAKKLCDICPVRLDCERNATFEELMATTRAGVAPWQRGKPAVPASGTAIRRAPGRPRGGGKKPAEEPSRLLSGRRAAVVQCVLDGYQESEGILALGIGADQYRNERRDWLREYTSDDPDAVIKFDTKSGKHRGTRASNLNGHAWTLAMSDCGSVYLVATRKAGQVRTWFLRSHQLEMVRTDVPLLKRYPDELRPDV